MDFFGSLSVSFCVWQFSCLSPFSLNNHKKASISRSFYRKISFSIIIIQIALIIFGFVFLDEILNTFFTQTIKTLDIIIMTLIQLTSLVILWEAYSKRNIQKNFFQLINSVDFILEYKIGIRLKYEQQKQINIRSLARWLFLDIGIFITNFVLFFMYFTFMYRWWAIFFVSFFFCSMRYYQITTVVDIIRYRYDEINQFINQIQPFDELRRNKFNIDLANVLANVHNQFRRLHKSQSIYEKLRDLRRVCRLLGSANNNLNYMFQNSIPLIIVNDFLHILINSYWVLRIIIESDTKICYLLPPLLWTFLNFNHVISLASVCHHATEEVCLIFLLN